MGEELTVEASRTGADAEDGTTEVANDVAFKRLVLVNVAYVGAPSGPWVLIDAGVTGTADVIAGAAKRRFGDRKPEAIVMTHGHFDHTGALATLAERWNVPIFAHPEEIPFLNGTECYAPPDPSVGGGLMSALSGFYPRGPIDVGRWLTPLAEDRPGEGEMPVMAGWRWIHTPGQTPGHVSFWRASDRTLLAGDAFITTRQESAYAVAVQKPELNGPPKYYTSDWTAARASVRRLSVLEPELVVTGHGIALRGEDMRASLAELARDFDWLAIPDQGRYVPPQNRIDAA